MNFAPKTEEEIDEESLIPEGEWDFEVIVAKDKVSASGNDMIELKLKVWANPNERVMTDWILEKFAHKLRHFCEATGLIDQYNSGSLVAEDCLGKTGRLIVGRSKNKQTGKLQASVTDYVGESASGGRNPRLEQVALKDDNIPF